MTNSRDDKNMKAAMTSPRDYSRNPAMTNASPTETSHASTASDASASPHSQLPLQTDDSFHETALKEQPLHDNKMRSKGHAKPSALSRVDKRQQDKPYHHAVAEQGMNHPAEAYPRTQERQVDNPHAQSDENPRTKEQLVEELSRTNVHLMENEGQLKKLHNQYQKSLATKDQQYYGLQEQVQDLKDLTDELRAQIDQKDREVDDFRQRWKDTAKELRKYQAKEKVVDQDTDSELTQKASQIQYNVRNFAYQHFGGELKIRENVLDSWRDWRKYLHMSTDFLEACLNSPVKRPMLVGATLWDFLVHEVFNMFWWGGRRVHSGMGDITDILSKRLQSDISADRSGAKRKYQMWKANTSALLVDALQPDQEEGQGMTDRLQEKVDGLCAQLAPLTKSKYEGLHAQISDIVTQALDLDQRFSKQVADVYWTVNDDGLGFFNEASMELQHGEKRTVDGQKVQLVVAPGLIKRGRSTGEDYEMISILLKITVSCELLAADNAEGSHKPSSPPRHFSKAGGRMREKLTPKKGISQSVIDPIARMIYG